MNVCGGSVRYWRRTLDCPVCGIAGSEIVCDVPDSPYYGGVYVCTNCGNRWGDGELLPRPFQRGWRQKSIEDAVAQWERACTCPPRLSADLGGIEPCEHQRASS